jgi:hypothetical protein
MVVDVMMNEMEHKEKAIKEIDLVRKTGTMGIQKDDMKTVDMLNMQVHPTGVGFFRGISGKK